ncbi:putative transcription factor GRAS family [Helianthus annuus]|nr:putative transcription factor GRAS family [Helianthus annuus]
MPSFDPLIFTRLHTYSKGVFQNQEINSRGALPLLYEGDGSGTKYNMAHGFSFSTGDHQVEDVPSKYFHSLETLFLDTTPPFPSYEHMMQELADIESQYSELIKPQIQSHEEAVQHETSGPKMSTNEIIRLGGERFIQSYSASTNNILIMNHPYGSSFSGLSDEEVKDVQLIVNLLLSAEKVTQQQFERSIKLLDWCDTLFCSSGNPVQRVVHYFSKALREKINKETGRVSTCGSGKEHVENLAGRLMRPNPASVFIYDKLPLFQAGLFSGVQALVDGVSGSKNVHVIDLTLKQGVQCTILMQALVSQPHCPVEHLKITAVGTDFKQETEQRVSG